MGDAPPWGTPDEQGSPAWGTPDATEAPALASSSPALLTVDEFLIKERGGFMSEAGYDLLTADGATHLGTVDRDPGGVMSWLFGSATTATYSVVDLRAGRVAQLVRPGSWGRMSFQVVLPDGHQAGVIEQENAMMTPRLTLRASDGSASRLTGGGWGSGGVRTLNRVSDGAALGDIAKVSGGLGGFLTGMDTYLVRLSPSLTGPSRLLAVVAGACLDLILNKKEESARASSAPNPGTF